MTEHTSQQSRTDLARPRSIEAIFVLLADTLVADFDVVEVLNLLANACVELLGATAAGILLGDQRGNLQVMASSSEQSRLLEVFQLQNDEGPCLDCYRGAQPISVADLSEMSARWPRFVPAAEALGFRAVHALPMRLRDDTLGALNLFHDVAMPMTEADLQVAQAFADTATIGLLQQRALHAANLLAEQLQTALNSRVVIEQAKGVLAAYGQINMDEAFVRLRDYARNNNKRLSDVARDVAAGDVYPRSVLESAKSGE